MNNSVSLSSVIIGHIQLTLGTPWKLMFNIPLELSGSSDSSVTYARLKFRQYFSISDLLTNAV
jgi:hypothetical protein